MTFVKELVAGGSALIVEHRAVSTMETENKGHSGMTQEGLISPVSILVKEEDSYFTEQWGNTDRTFASTDIWNKNFNNYLVKE